MAGFGKRGAAAIVVVGTIALGSAACGGSDDESATTAAAKGATAAGTTAAGSTKGITVKAAEFTWPAAKLTDTILQQITKQHPELGVSKITMTQLDPAPGWAGAGRGDIDVLTEVALPNQQPLADKVKDEVSLLHQTYGGASQGWFVPSYAVEPGGKLAGLKSVTDLPKYKSQLDGRLIDADPGWVTTQQNKKRLEGYGVNFQHVTSGEAAELAQLKRAYDRKQPILVYLYHPHWVFTAFQMTQLQEPKPFKPDCFTTGDGACAMPAFAAWVAARKDLQQRAPKFYAMLGKFEIPLADMEKMLKELDQEKKPAEEVATAWIQANASKIDGWLQAG